MKALKSLIDLIYPPRCLICQAFLQDQNTVQGGQDIPFCQTCFKEFTPIKSPICSLCGRPFSDGTEQDRICEECLRKRPSYDIARAPYLYDGALMTAIHELKYAQRSHLADSLGSLLALFAQTCIGELRGSLVMPVPLHPKRLRARGFNQSLLLARCVASKTGAELDFLSLRVVKKRTILLVDDVATTGSTLNECAKALKRAGADGVLCLVLARTSTA
ncbi:MAG: putative amidophosphoribosyltransferase [Deltaproteobacteria bacterium]|nr:putative amidophosphoribosyltransferase [Deltaproteobacteria bacterium]